MSRAHVTPTLVWLALVAATLASLRVASDSSTTSNSAAAFIVAIAFVKVGLVGWEFMELRRAAPWLRLAFGAYTLMVGAVLVVAVLVA